MRVQIRSNPKTPDGWIKRSAVALLVGVSTSMVVLPIAFFLFLGHYQSAYPNDTQNFLSALTAAVLVSILFAGLAFAATMMLYLLLSLRGTSTAPKQID